MGVAMVVMAMVIMGVMVVVVAVSRAVAMIRRRSALGRRRLFRREAQPRHDLAHVLAGDAGVVADGDGAIGQRHAHIRDTWQTAEGGFDLSHAGAAIHAANGEAGFLAQFRTGHGASPYFRMVSSGDDATISSR